MNITLTHNTTNVSLASLAPSRARAQCQELGKHFTGGLDCVAFRLPIFT